MAAVKPGFITGANARIKLGGRTLAYCTDLSFTVDVATIPIEVIGTYEVKSYEPVAYAVAGAFSVVRYTANDKLKINANKAGNSAHLIGGKTPATDGTSIGTHLNPGQILTSSTFDMEIQQGTAQAAVDTTGDATTVTSVFKIQDCRVVRRGSSVSKRGVMVDSYQFVGVMAGDVDVAGNEAKTSGTLDLG